MDKEKLLSSGLLEQYVLGLTTEEESLMVESLAAEHEEVRKELTLLQKAMEHYASRHPSPEALETPAGVNKSNMGLRKLNGKVLWPMATAFTFIWAMYGALRSDIQHHQLLNWKYQYNLLSQDCQAKQNSIQTQAEISSFIQHRHTSKIILSGISMCQGHFAVAYWNPAAERCFLDMGSLPPAPKGKCYQVWADVDCQMVSAGVVKCPSHAPLQEIRYIKQASSLNITLEPDGGSQEPTVSLLQANGLLASN